MLLWTTYDPDQPEGSRSQGGQYMSKKDILPIAGVIAVLAALSVPVYLTLAGESARTVCKRNLSGISKAVLQYAAQYDDRLPPLYAVGENGSPVLVGGAPVTWATEIEGFLNSTSSLTCEAAKEGEPTPIVSGKAGQKKPALLTYGMYRTFSAVAMPTLQDASSSVMISETSNHGAGQTYDPIPYTDLHDKEVPFDGFSIAWDNSNFTPDDHTQTVTRLAFSGAVNGDFGGKDVTARHGKFIFALMGDGHLGRVSPLEAFVDNTKDGIMGRWRVMKSYTAFEK